MNRPYLAMAAAVGVLALSTAAQARSPVEQRLARLESRLTQLETENRRLKDINEISRVQSLYAHYINMNASDKIVGLFADSDEVEIEVTNKGVLVGKTAPMRWRFGDDPKAVRSDAPRPAGQMSMHMTDNPVIELSPDGTRAKAVWLSPGVSTLRLARDGGTKVTAMWNWGKYEMEYLKQNGQWKILVLRYHQVFLTPYDKGWTVESTDPDTTRERVKPDRASKPDFYNPYRVDKPNTFEPGPPTPYAVK
jgi:hypothetical protein